MEEKASDFDQESWCPLYGPIPSPADHTEEFFCDIITTAREIWYVRDDEPQYASELLPPPWKVKTAQKLALFCEDVLRNPSSYPNCPNIYSIPVTSVSDLKYGGHFIFKDKDVLRLNEHEVLSVQAIAGARYVILAKKKSGESMTMILTRIIQMARQYKTVALIEDAKKEAKKERSITQANKRKELYERAYLILQQEFYIPLKKHMESRGITMRGSEAAQEAESFLNGGDPIFNINGKDKYHEGKYQKDSKRAIKVKQAIPSTKKLIERTLKYKSLRKAAKPIFG